MAPGFLLGDGKGWLTRRSLGVLLPALFLIPACASDQAQTQAQAQAAGPYDAYTGVYRVGTDHMVGVTRFITDGREDAILMSDYQSGVVRRLFQVSDAEFVMGPGFAVQEPAELTVRFLDDADGAATGLSLQPTGGDAVIAERAPLSVEEVIIDAGEARLSATLMVPGGGGPRPAIVLLHGSGPLTRWSFGPYPHFFASLGFAVVIYDKRGTGGSTGERLDASSGALATMPDAYYPDGLANDALAVFDFLQQRPEINPDALGFWGSSEGGMLSTQVAARNPDVAFAINSSGFSGPLWETLAYQVEPILRRDGHPEDIEEAQELTELWMRVARTGEDYELFLEKREEALRNGKPWLLSYVSDEFISLEQMRWAWDHILAFDPLPALAEVNTPVLGVFGEADPLTDASAAANAMEDALPGSADFTARIFPNAGHSLSEQPGGARMALGVFDTLRVWLRERVPLPEPR